MRSISVTTPTQISVLLDYVHDRRFRLDGIKFDPERETLTLPVEVRVTKPKRILGIPFNGTESAVATVTFRGVTAWRILNDDSQIGYGDINRILSEGGRIVIEGGLPVNVEMQVRGLEIELTAPGELALA